MVAVGQACVVALGGVHGCLGGMCGCSGGVCVVAWEVCMVAPGACMVAWGACVVASGVCVVAPGGHAWFFLGAHAWFLPGGMRGFFWGVCMVFSGEACMVFPGGGMHRIRRDTVNERAVRILLECILVLLYPFEAMSVSQSFSFRCEQSLTLRRAYSASGIRSTAPSSACTTYSPGNSTLQKTFAY